jgi:hypothetical protein
MSNPLKLAWNPPSWDVMVAEAKDFVNGKRDLTDHPPFLVFGPASLAVGLGGAMIERRYFDTGLGQYLAIGGILGAVGLYLVEGFSHSAVGELAGDIVGGGTSFLTQQAELTTRSGIYDPKSKDFKYWANASKGCRMPSKQDWKKNWIYAASSAIVNGSKRAGLPGAGKCAKR